MRSAICPALLFVLLGVTVAAMAQTTTGRLIGTVFDDSGAVLPGATVSIASPALIGGVRSSVVDSRGEFSFIGLAPGIYTVRCELAGFVPQERNQVKVSLGGAVSLQITMPEATFAGEIEVRAVTPVVDPTQVNTGQVFDRTYMQRTAIGSVNRAYTTVVNQTAGVIRGSDWAGMAQTKVLGSTIGDNAFFIDGMDATNPVMGTATAVLNFDAIEEIQLQTGGFEAEYGRATGGIINVLTRSGGNDFSGTADIRYRDESFQESGDHFDVSELSTEYRSFAVTLGGPILQDTVWFFASYEWLNDVFTPIGSPTTRDHEGQDYLGKITWQVNDGWRLNAKYTSDPMEIDNFYASRSRMPEATAHKRGQTQVFSTELSAVLSDSVFLSATLGRYAYESEVYPQAGDLSTIGHFNYTTDVYTENYEDQQYWRTNRSDFTTDLTWFVDSGSGAHEIKAGAEYSDLDWRRMHCYTGTPHGERCVSNGAGYVFYDADFGEGTVPSALIEARTTGQNDFDGAISTVFFQDAWRPLRSLTVKVGLRYDTVSYDTIKGLQIADMDKLQPRVGAAWDISGDSKTVVRGSWGRFMHPHTLILPKYAMPEAEPWYEWWSCSTYWGSQESCIEAGERPGWDYRPTISGWDPLGWVLSPDSHNNTEPGQVDAGLRASYSDELILAFERELGHQSSIEFTFTDKKTRDLSDDTFLGNWPTPSPEADSDAYILANIPDIKRDYRGYTLKYESRGIDWVTLLASYTYSSSRGSQGYTQARSWLFDQYPWHYENLYGYLSDHRRHQLKMNGYFMMPADWSIAFDAYWASPFRWAPVEDVYDNPELNHGYHVLEPRGNREANTSYQLDLQISKGFTTGNLHFVLIASVLNALGNEQPTYVCEMVRGCVGGFAMGEPMDWQTPRRYEAGFRLEF